MIEVIATYIAQQASEMKTICQEMQKHTKADPLLSSLSRAIDKNVKKLKIRKQKVPQLMYQSFATNRPVSSQK